MKERPILFSGEDVRAILDGRKTQWREVVKPQPEPVSFGWRFGGRDIGEKVWPVDAPKLCPYGMPGDRLWVRETFAPFEQSPGFIYRADADTDGSVPYLDTGAGGLGGGVCHYRPKTWKRSIFMPRRASRILLDVLSVRVERLCSISEADALAEGCCPFSDDFGSYQARVAFCQLWESINGPESWDANPWVWAVEFRFDERNLVT
jgi:hypothetical protein